MDWQTPTALLIVGISLASFLYSSVKASKKAGCGKNCGCEQSFTERSPD